MPEIPDPDGPMDPIYAYALAIDGYALLPIPEGRKLLDLAEQFQAEGRERDPDRATPDVRHAAPTRKILKLAAVLPLALSHP